MDQQTQYSVKEYLAALQASELFGPQVVACKTLAGNPGQAGSSAFLSSKLQQMLRQRGIDQLYSHQKKAIRHVMQGHNVLVATPTASGKSLIYTLPVFSELIINPAAKALFLFPLKALARDQLKTIEQMAALLPDHFADKGLQPAAVFDGDTSSYMRRKIRENLPGILITNPDMLHLSLLPYQDAWGHLFANLHYVILDEVHTYKGVFGSHMAWLLKRLQRTCRLYGSNPVFLLSSATIGNPEHLAANLLGQKATIIVKSGAPRPPRHIALLNPLQSAPAAASMLLQASVHRKLRTIVYTQSRRMTELITIWTQQRLKEQTASIASYRAGFLPEERRSIEQRLTDGSLLGVISTSALELGIDIGNLDICLLVGYPGSMMATWQRAGRVGRGMQESLVVMIGQEDALDQHFMRNPDDFFSRQVEDIAINPDNQVIAGAHLTCMAAEAPLSLADSSFDVTDVHTLLDQLTAEGQLLCSASGKTWFAARKFPQREVNLRGGGTVYNIIQQNNRNLLGTIDGFRALKECHQGAVYLHRAQSYLVKYLDLQAHEIQVDKASPPFYTRTMTSKQTEILEQKASMTCGCSRVHFGRLRVTETITGYQKIVIGSQKVIARIPLDLPPHIFVTQGLWLEIPEWIRQLSEQQLNHFMGGIHALEHAMIAILPLMVLCDRNDIGGISYPWHEQTDGSAIFIYDGHAGGVGLTERGFAGMKKLLANTLQLIEQCSCERGCPSCVHSPKCGSGNRPIDKPSCLFILKRILKGHEPAVPGSHNKAPIQSRQPVLTKPETHQTKCTLPENYGVFDVETQLSAQEVGGWHHADKMRISVAVLYEARQDRFVCYEEDAVGDLIEKLFGLDLVVGFNNKRFDNMVLSAYTSRPLSALPSLDILEEISSQLGYRLSLNRLAEHTLGVKKSSDGLAALRWFKQGKIDKISKYCTMDVRITRDLFLHGIRHRHLLFQNKAGHIVRLPVHFNRAILKTMARQ